MDGSNYRPQREEPHDYKVGSGANRSFIFLIILSALITGAFFLLNREEALDIVNCLTGTSCGAASQAPPTTSTSR